MNKIWERAISRLKDTGVTITPDRENFCFNEAEMAVKDVFAGLVGMEGKKLIWHEEYNHVIEWLKNTNGKGLFMYGRCGTGKTMLACKIIPILFHNYYERVFTICSAAEMNKRVDEILKKHLIVLDDLGTEGIYNNFGTKRNVFEEIMDSVEKEGKLIIITTNLPNSGRIIADYGERAWDRIRATTIPIKFDFSSMRG